MNENDTARSMNEGQERYIEGFDEGTGGKEATWNTWT
jgi:hypothetical protein